MSNLKTWEDYQASERSLIKYIEEYLKINWEITNEEFIDLSRKATTYTAKASAVLRDQERKVKSILKIKIIPYWEFKREPIKPWPSHILETATLLYLAKIETGYLCVCTQKHSKQEIFEFRSELQKLEQSYYEEITIPLNSRLVGLKTTPLVYEIREFWSNKKRTKDPSVKLWKIAIKRGNMEQIINAIDNWWNEHQEVSPDLTRKEKRITHRFFRRKS